ncbi:MAG: DUF3050 domain-containing protein, partial [Candidatus Margulisiibacteriota bacterium]|nr:DUF3050 domain-containing protein [Candidatus Margulisiibacteriota bacterium]
FGRETLIPSMFLNIITNLDETPEINNFKSYLNRHIELDGEEHSHLAIELIQELCGNNKENWKLATKWAKLAIQTRVKLYSNIITYF